MGVGSRSVTPGKGERPPDRASVAVGRTQREQGPIRPSFIHRPCEGRSCEQTLPVGMDVREFLADPVRPVGVEQCRRRRAIGEAERITRRPFPAGHDFIEPAVRRIQPLARLADAVWVAMFGRTNAVDRKSVV